MRAIAAVLALVMLVGCGDDDGRYVSVQQSVVAPDGSLRGGLGRTCSRLEDGKKSTNTLDTGVGVVTTVLHGQDDGAQVTVDAPAQNTSLQRRYDSAWFGSNTPDVIDIPLATGDTYHLRLQGGAACSD